MPFDSTLRTRATIGHWGKRNSHNAVLEPFRFRPPRGDGGTVGTVQTGSWYPPKRDFSWASWILKSIVSSDVIIDNILVQDMQVKQRSDMVSLEAKIVTSGLPKASVLDSFELAIRPHCVSDQIVQIHCVQDKLPIFQLTNGIVALEAAFVQSEDPLIICVDQETTVYPHGSSMVKEITMLDLCAGGFGGWSTAMEILAYDFDISMKKIIGIDYDHSAMQYWALNHSASCIETQQIAWQALHKLPGNIAIVGDLQSNQGRQAVFHQHPQVTTISAPCVSWSGAGKEQGFHAQGGIVPLTDSDSWDFLDQGWCCLSKWNILRVTHISLGSWDWYMGRLSHGMP